jgi:hypothetical protein
MSVRAAPPTVAELEGRLAPAVNILFDFRYDTSEFFTDHPDRVTVLRTAAADVASKFTDTLAAIPFPAAGDSWRAQFDRPSGLGEFVEITNLPVPANAVVVFVGARDLPGTELVRPTADREASGTAQWQELARFSRPCSG